MNLLLSLKRKFYNMGKNTNIYLIQFDKLTSFLKGLNDIEIANLESGNFEIKMELVSKKDYLKNSPSRVLSYDEFAAQQIIDELNNFNNREEGLKFLLTKCSSRIDLESIARRMDIPFQKKDTIDKLKEKIIESSIGFRLRSQAIQGGNTKDNK